MYIAFSVYCYACPVSWLVITVDLLRCPIYKPSFITGVYVEEKTSYLWGQASGGALECVPVGGDTEIACSAHQRMA